MQIYKTQVELKDKLNSLGAPTLGLVPTMGALHEGHLSLVKMALVENEFCVVSVFVNPTQFDNPDDLKKYPRTLKGDVELLKTLGDKILIYAPSAQDLYGKEIKAVNYNFGPIAKEMEGAFRKGHFDGVGTIVSLLFEALLPSAAYFGEKDFQQLQIIKKLVEIKDFEIRVVGCKIIRETNGLAKSSRNARLSKNQFEEAALIYKTLQEVKQRWGDLSISKLNEYVTNVFENHDTLTVEYFIVANEATLKTAKRKRIANTYRAFIVVFSGEVRLIDNLSLGKG